MPNPVTGTIQQEYIEHLKFDPIVAGNVGPGFNPGASTPPTTISANYMDNLLGLRTGIGITTPWSTPIRTGMRVAAYNDNNSGATVTYAATTVTDTAKAWVVNEWVNRFVISVGTGSGVTFGQVASNTATVLTLTAAGWSNGTPAANAFYTIIPARFTSATNIVFRDSWNQGIVRQDGNSEQA